MDLFISRRIAGSRLRWVRVCLSTIVLGATLATSGGLAVAKPPPPPVPHAAVHSPAHPHLEVVRRPRASMAKSFVYAPGEGMPITRRMAQHLTEELGPRPLQNAVLFFAGHHMRETPPMMEEMRDLGLDPENIFAVSVPYSAKSYTKKVLNERDGLVPFTTPKDGVAGMQDHVKKRLKEAIIFHIKHPGTKLSILEDGGYAAIALPGILAKLDAHPEYGPLLRKNFHLAGMTEQTAAGIRRYETHRPDQLDLPGGQRGVPVYNVAGSWIKARTEAPEVAQMVVDSLNRHLRAWDGISLNGAPVLAIGYGSVGRFQAGALVGRGVQHVMVADKSSKARDDARRELSGLAAGFHHRPRIEVEDSDEPSIASIRAAKVILGTTGFRTIDKRVIDNASDGTYFASGSSKTNEIDLEYLKSQAVKQEAVEGHGSRFTMRDGRTLTVVADGQPVNFWNRHISLPSHTIDPVLAELVWAVTTLHAGSNRPNAGIHHIPSGVQKNLVGWMQDLPWTTVGAHEEPPAHWAKSR
jgi:S-adenosylhomocysteine hydrolase